MSFALAALEFDRIREALAGHALTPLGRARAEALAPSPDAAEVADRLALTAEAVRYAAGGGTLGLWAPEDLPIVLGALEIDGQILDPLQLVALARFVESVDTAATGIGHGAAQYPRLAARVHDYATFGDECAAVTHAIDPGGDVSDHASAALRDIREKLRRQRARLRATLEGLSKGRDTAKYLQDQIVTDRNGRYVLVVRAEHRDSIPGIVHGSSASGASLYLEPLATVELNNETVTLTEQERAEVQRILLALTEGFRRRADDMERLLDAAADIDELFAKVELADVLDGVAPEIARDGRLEWRGARHPLLVLAMKAKRAGVAMPSDLLVQPPHRALVISGPNTGGKTVALKAFGLLALMAQSGVLIPVERGSAFTPFQSIFADIGDDQSISASLSTFSAHIAHLVEMERTMALPALILLDEIGSGTDPIEGGALGTAVIDHFLARGATVVATTHDDALKSYAATTAGVQPAAFGFVADTYAPTYRLVYGAPGRSLALEIAQRLGMPARVIADARARTTGRESQLAAHLQRVDKELAALDAEKRKTLDEREALARERAALLARESRLTEREAVLKRRTDDKINEQLRVARAEIDKVVADLKTKTAALSGQAAMRLVTTGEIGSARAEARELLDVVESIAIAGHAPARAPEDAPPPRVPPDGTRVFVTTFGVEGIVRGGSGKNVDVEIRGKRMRVKLGDIRSPGSGVRSPGSGVRSSGSGGPGPGFRASSAGSTTRSSVSEEASRELNLIGATVDDARDRLEKFVDDALLADVRVLRIVHGHGTGKLREAVRQFFKKHPLVADVAVAPDNQGGGGATVVTLRE